MRLSSLIGRQQGALFAWCPVLFGIGILIFFGWKTPPGVALIYGGFMAGLSMTLLGLWIGRLWRVVPIALGLVVLGFGLAGVRTVGVAAPVLDWRYYGPIEGRVVAIDRSGSDKVRLTLDHVQLLFKSAAETPEKVRISLHNPESFTHVVPGMHVATTGFLSPPQGPVEPGGFDFRRHAWFAGIGAVGYTRAPVLRLAPAEGGPAIRLYQLRMAISEGLQARMAEETGPFAATILVGDRSGMTQARLAPLRVTNLAHLLAISGLHMGLLTGIVFAVTRVGLALIPPVALRLPTKKIAAVAALCAAAGYLALSGANVATERAFVMVAVMLIGVLANRRAISLRSVAIAAFIVLGLRPEAVLSPGFQMSFAATLALVGAFAGFRTVAFARRIIRPLPQWVRWAGGLFFSSAIAGAATAPFAGAHFNQFASYGLVANMLSVPLMGAVVMPAALVALLLLPLGAEALGLWAMHLGISWIIGVADMVAGWDGAARGVPSPDAGVLLAIALGGLWLVFWRGAGKWAGLPVVLTAFWIWGNVTRPDVLISGDGALMGALGPEGRALSKPKGTGFAAMSWFENDGDWADQAAGFARAGLDVSRTTVALPGHVTLISSEAKARKVDLDALCAQTALLVVMVRDATARGGCRLLTAWDMARDGAIAVFLGKGPDEPGLEVRTARAHIGRRRWAP